MSCWIFKAERRFLYSLLLLAFSAYFTQANASVCFLPDATNCGTDSIINQCDGVRFFGKGKCSERLGEYQGAGGKKAEDGNNRLTYMTCSSAGDVCDELKCIWSSESACRNNADSSSSPDYHYECYWDADNGCWYQTKTPCYTYDDPDSNSSYPLDAPDDNKACKSNTWNLTHHKCTEKGIAYTEPGTRTTYDCVDIKTDVRGCSGYNLDAELPGYDCQSCETDVYKTDYYGNYNYSGKGNTVYSCSKTAGCSGYDLTASQKATKEASGDYRCHECTPTVTDSDGNTSTGTTVYKCGKITTSTNGCSEYTVSQADKATKESQGYSCEPCTPTTTYYEDGVEYDSKSNPTVYKCGSICDVHTKKSTDCKGNTNFVSAGAKFPGTDTVCGDCVNCADENNLPTTSACYGLHLCDGGREPEGETPCYCGKYKYYTKCMVNETCKSETTYTSENGGDCKDYSLGNTYNVKEKCTQSNGSTIYWQADCTTAKDCNGNPGPAYGLKTCPDGEGIGDSVVECGGAKWYTDCKCKSEYTYLSENGGDCKDYSLGNTYNVKEKCTQSNGSTIYWQADCTTAKDCNGNPGPAYGLKTCPDGEGIGDSVVECGGAKWYTDCKCKSEYTYLSENGGDCKDYSLGNTYNVKEKCTQSNGSTIYWQADCTTAKDCKGNPGPAYGLKTCPSGSVPSGKTVTCGGTTFGETCKAECSYDHDEDMCKKAGKTFVKKCHDNNNKWWGECQ